MYIYLIKFAELQHIQTRQYTSIHASNPLFLVYKGYCSITFTNRDTSILLKLYGMKTGGKIKKSQDIKKKYSILNHFSIFQEHVLDILGNGHNSMP